MKTLLILLIVAFTLPAFSQGRLQSSSGTIGSMPKSTGSQKEDGEKPKEAKADSIKSRIYSWKLDNNYSVVKRVELDTTMFNFHNYDPIFKKSISNTSLGYYGSPYSSNIFKDRSQSSDFYFLRSFDAYTLFQPDVQYYNTTTPYSFLRYTQGEENTFPELTFQGFYTQNIDPYTNFGFQFNTIKSTGHYPNQQGHHRFLNFFMSRQYKNYNGYLSFIRSKNTIKENGGLANPSAFTGVGPTDGIAVNLSSGTNSDYLHYSLFTLHEYKFQFPKADSIIDSLNTDSVTRKGEEYGIEYMLKLDKYKRSFTETSLNNSTYKNLYTDSLGGYIDSLYFQSVTSRLQLKAYESPYRRFTFSARAYIENEVVWAVHPIRSGQTTYRYSNLTAGGELSRNNGVFGTWSGTARFVLLGRNLGDAIVKGNYEKDVRIFNDTLKFRAQGWYQDQSADIFEEHLVLNRIKWENNNFKKEHRVVLNSELEMPDYKIVAGGNYTLISNFLYNDAFALPAQYSTEFSLLSVWLEKKSLFGHLGWDNKVVWQALSDTRALNLPTWSIYSNFFFHHTLFKVMQLQIGTELFYNAKFYAPAYEPVTSQFYYQNTTKTGGYPLLNVYANAKLKRTSAFVKLYHPASGLLGSDFMSSPGYPLNDYAFRVGFFWTFYD